MRGSTTLSAGTWYHVAATYDGTSDVSGVQLYVNGVVETKTTITNGLTASTVSTVVLGIGNDSINTGANAGLIGNIDEAAIFNTTLTAAQVAEIYNGRNRINLNAHSKAANLVGYWRLGDPTALHDGTNFQIPSSKSDLGNKKSILFDGVNEYVNINDVKTVLATTTQGTWSTWVKLVDATPTAADSFIGFGDTDANSRINLNVGTTGLL